MSLDESELSQLGLNRYSILVIGGNSIFLADRILGHKLYMGPFKAMPMPDFKRHVLNLTHDLSTLSLAEFFSKHNLSG